MASQSPHADALGGSSLKVNFDFGAGLPLPKRRKTTVACELCRVRKSKCDGVRPTCGPCSRRKSGGDACTYPEGRTRSGQTSPDRKSGGRIENKANSDTKGNQLSGYRADPVPYSSSASSKSISMNSMHDHDTNPRLTTTSPSAQSTIGSRLQYPSGGGSQVRQPSRSPGVSDPSGDNDAMGDVDNWGLKVGLLGASSSASFVQSISKAVEGQATSEQDRELGSTTPGRALGRTLYRKQSKVMNTHSPDYVLPPRKTADRLLDIHWNFSHVIFPWLDRIRLMTWYEGLWTGQENPDPYVDEQVFYCILNTIFAISYKLDPQVLPEEQDRLANSHFKRAQKLLSFNLLEICHIGLIQALLLMCQYLQSTNMPRECAQCIGLATWIAQDLGLDIPETLSSIQSQHEREMARRAWHGCVLMDRITSMTFGRATRILREVAIQSPLPAAIDDEYLDVTGLGTGSQPDRQPSKLTFFVSYCELHIILGDILSTYYAARLPPEQGLDQSSHGHSSGKHNVDKLLQFDKSLNIWRENLEPHLQINTDFQDPTETLIFRRQAISLYLRFLHIRMLLYRPFFSKLPEASSLGMSNGIVSRHPPLAESIACRGLVACVQAAQQIIELISSHIAVESPRVLPPWWYVISYVYNASTVVIAAHLFPAVVDWVSISSLTTSVRQGFDILQHYEDSRKSAQRCKSALGVLYDKILSPVMRRQSPNGTLVTPDMSMQTIHLDPDLHADFGNDAATLDLFGSDLLWLNAVPFDPVNNFWL